MTLPNSSLTWLANGEPATGDPTGAGHTGVLNRPLWELLQNDQHLNTVLNLNFIEVSGLYTSSNGDYILADAQLNGFTINLPLTPDPYDKIVVLDTTGAFSVNNVTVARNGENINGVAEDLILDLHDSEVKLMYINPTIGWKFVFTYYGSYGGGGGGIIQPDPSMMFFLSQM